MPEVSSWLDVPSFGERQHKERLVPFSLDLRRRIYGSQQLRERKRIAGDFLFVGFEQ